jgi:hypothetical protein
LTAPQKARRKHGEPRAKGSFEPALDPSAGPFELGRLWRERSNRSPHLITPERRRKAAEEIKEGLVFCLSLPLDLPGGNLLVAQRHPPRRKIEPRNEGYHFVNFPLRFENEHWTDIACDDAVTIWTQYSTQWDALSHIAEPFDVDEDGVDEIVYYNGYRATIDILGPHDPGGPGARNLGIEHMAETGVQGRGVLVDLFARHGAKRAFVGYDELMRIMEEEKVVVETGDMFCVHTGWSQAVMDRKGNPDVELLHNSYAVLDGADERLLHDRRVGLIRAHRRQFRRGGLPDKKRTAPRALSGIADSSPLHCRAWHPSRRALVSDRAQQLAESP